MFGRVTCTAVVAAVALCGAALADPIVTVTLTSPQNGLAVAPGSTIEWTISVSVEPGTNAGLALISCDLMQDAGNPTFFDIPLASGIPAAMAKFDRPGGITNPGEGAASGYVGVQRGDAGHMNLVQIGGGMNTFGQALPPGTGLGEVADPDCGIGQSGAQVVATGSFTAPCSSFASGTYTFNLDSVRANVMSACVTPPDFSPVVQAAVDTSAGSFTVTVRQAIGDLNCDCVVNNFDIAPFVKALTNPAGYEADYPNCDAMLGDVNDDGTLNNFDIAPFVQLLTGGK
ncbi:MAG: hypothetical protein PVJ57_04785 [Phycisphaerae bacterium]|jgi:hypothetical protein